MVIRRALTAALALIVGASAAAFCDALLSTGSAAQAAPVHSVVAAPATTTAGGYVAVTPVKVADTRTGAGNNRKGALPAKKAASFQISGRGSVPRTGVGAAQVRVVVISPAQSGSLTLYRSLTPAPTAYSVQFTAGQQSVGATVVRLSSTGRIAVMNHSAAAVQIVLYVDGYFTATTAADAASTPGAFVPVTPKRVLDTRTGAGGNRRGRVSGKSQFTVQVGGKASVPASAGAVAGVLSVMSPARSGGAIAWQSATTRPSTPSVQFNAGQNAGALVVVPLAANGRIGLRNDSSGMASFVFDVVGYYVPGVATQQAAANFVVATTPLQPTSVKANRTVTVRVSSALRIPVNNVAAVAAVVGVSAPAASGSVLAYPEGQPAAAVTAAQYTKSIGASTALLLPVSSTGRVTLQNKATRTRQLSLTVVGYVLQNTVVNPVYSSSHYIRRAMTGDDADVQWMQNLGMADAANGSNLIVLHIGAQRPDKTAWLSAMPDSPKYEIPYARLAVLIQAYLAGFGPHPDAVVAVATNNSGPSWSTYGGAQRGADWWTQVIAPLQGLGTPVYGADDIESSFGTGDYSDALAWENGYLAAGAAAAKLVFTGSANGCPYKSIGQTGPCNNGWTQAEYYQLAGGTNPSQVFALPQIYNDNLAVQWPNIDLAGGGQISFLGALTEAAACVSPGQSCDSFSPAVGLAALTQQLAAAAIGVPNELRATDLDIQK